MKWALRNALLFCCAVLAVAAAIHFPPALSRLADHQLEETDYIVQAETLDVSLVYRLSTVERLMLLAEAEGRDALVLTGDEPAQDELSAEQAFHLLQEESDRLFTLGILPCPFQATGLSEITYTVLRDRNASQQSVSLWVVSATAGDKYTSYTAELVMDAQTGLIYSLQFYFPGDQSLDLQDVASAWGTYLELGIPAIQEEFNIQSVQGSSGTVIWTSPDTDYLTAAYQTEDGTIQYYFQLVHAMSKTSFSSLIIAPSST